MSIFRLEIVYGSCRILAKTGLIYLIAKHAVIETLNRLIAFQGLPFEDLAQLLEFGYNRKIFVMEDGVKRVLMEFGFLPRFLVGVSSYATLGLSCNWTTLKTFHISQR